MSMIPTTDDEIMCLKSEISRLKSLVEFQESTLDAANSIISQLPTTEDGVPIYPGVEVFFFDVIHKEIRNLTVVSVFRSGVFDVLGGSYFIKNGQQSSSRTVPVFFTRDNAVEWQKMQLQEQMDSVK